MRLPQLEKRTSSSFAQPIDIFSAQWASRSKVSNHLGLSVILESCSHFPGDFDTDRSAREFARKSFREDPKTEPGTRMMAQRIEHAQGVTKILKENIVQGKLAENKDDTYKLRLTKDTQRFDNEQTSKLKGTTKTFKEIKDAQF
jgi:complex III assembly factor LYRM7